MTNMRTSLGCGETWVPLTGESADFAKRFTKISEAYYRRKLTMEARNEWRSEQLQRVLNKVATKSAFYQRHLADIDLSTVHADNLSTLPFTTKDDLRREMFDVLSGEVNDALYFYETTGTTGRATPCPRDGKEIISSNSHVTESWRAIFKHHFGDHKPAIGLMGPTEAHSFGDTLGDVAKNIGCCNAKIWPYSPVIGFQKALQLMKDLRLEVVVATPGVCLNLARAAREYGYDIKKDFASLKLFFVTGEMCTPALAKNIDTLWGVTTYNILYGSQEAFVMGVASPSRQMRFADVNYIAEIIDPETNESMGDRGTGELCVTMLADGVKPLIRYRTGDLVTLKDDDYNDIDQPGPIIEVIGRVLDRIELGNGSFAAGAIEQAVLEGVSNCYGYQIVINNVNGKDALTVKMQFDGHPEDHKSLETRIATRIREQFGVQATVEFVDALDDIVSTGAFVSWKAARIVDNRREKTQEDKVAASMSKNRGIDT